jgi:hypothetical protein
MEHTQRNDTSNRKATSLGKGTSLEWNIPKRKDTSNRKAKSLGKSTYLEWNIPQRKDTSNSVISLGVFHSRYVLFPRDVAFLLDVSFLWGVFHSRDVPFTRDVPFLLDVSFRWGCVPF